MLHRIPGMIGRLGTAARRNVGTNVGNLVEVLSGGKLPALDGSDLTGISGAGRTLLTANLNFYVDDANGDDSNSGLAAGSGNALKTINAAINKAVALDGSIYNVTINVAAGTYTHDLTLKNYIGSGTWSIVGAGSTSIISTTSTSAVKATDIRTPWTVSGFKLGTTTSGHSVAIARSTLILKDIEFGSVGSGMSHMQISQSVLTMTGSFIVSAGAATFWNLVYNTTLFAAGTTITLSGTPAFSFFAQLRNMSHAVVNNITWAGTGATGTRHNLANLSLVDTLGAGTSYFPGNASGTVDSSSKFA